jgi:hypothetical protein
MKYVENRQLVAMATLSCVMKNVTLTEYVYNIYIYIYRLYILELLFPCGGGLEYLHRCES